MLSKGHSNCERKGTTADTAFHTAPKLSLGFTGDQNITESPSGQARAYRGVLSFSNMKNEKVASN